MVMLYFQVQASKQEDRKMQMDRLTNNRKPRNYDEAKARSERYARACRRDREMVDGSVKDLLNAKWSVKENRWPRRVLSDGTVFPARVYYTTEANIGTLESLAYWTAEAIGWDGKVNEAALDNWSSKVALALLKAQGYRVAADADYDWVCNVLGKDAENIYCDAYDAVTESVDYIKSDY